MITKNKVFNPKAEEAKSNPDSQNVLVALCHPSGVTFLVGNNKKRVTLNGNAENLRGLSQGILPIGGFGLTEILASDWEAIKTTYGKMPLFKNGLIFAAKDADSLKAEAKEKAELRHGREPLDVENPSNNATYKPQTSKANLTSASQ